MSLRVSWQALSQLSSAQPVAISFAALASKVPINQRTIIPLPTCTLTESSSNQRDGTVDQPRESLRCIPPAVPKVKLDGTQRPQQMGAAD